MTVLSLFTTLCWDRVSQIVNQAAFNSRDTLQYNGDRRKILIEKKKTCLFSVTVHAMLLHNLSSYTY